MSEESVSPTSFVAIVTGGAKGFGAGIADALVASGYEVFITGRDEQALARRESTKIHPLVADATSPTDWDRVFSTVLSRFGKVDVLVNDAGGGVRITELENQTDEDITEAISLNLTAAIYGCRRAAPIMRKQKSGIIINISSVCSRHSWPGWGVYGAAKAGLENFSRSLYLELRPHGVRVTTVVPSWGATGFNASAQIPDFDQEKQSKCIFPSDLGKLVSDICALPERLWLQEVILWPVEQEVSPL
jgi:NAD(P)-dependent dehydrogenase (short-subunit alcohol dehydrogenase family)